MNIFSYVRNCIILTSVQNQHKCVVFSWKHALLWNSWWCYRKRNSTSVKEKWPRMKKKTSEAFSLGKVEKNVRVFWSCMLLNTCRKIRPKRGEDDGWWRKRTRRMRGVKKQNEKYSLLFSTHLFSHWLLLVEKETYYYDVCEEGLYQSSALGFKLAKYFRKWDYRYCELTKVFFTPLAKIRLNLQNQEQVSSTAMWI